MTSINTNLSSLIVQKNLTKSTSALNQAIERLTTGYKINHASDNAANYSISESMTSKLSSYMVAEENTSMGLDLIRTQSSTLDTIQNLTTRLRALAEQAHNGTYGAQSLSAINQEANAIISEIERIGNNAEYNGIKLFDNAISQAGIPQLKSNGLMQEVERRDTSEMTKLADVEIIDVLSEGTYSITTKEELEKLATIVNDGDYVQDCEFVLGADIDLNGMNWTSIGNNGHFCGIFDGNGYTISNMYINADDDYGKYVGLFGRISHNAIIKNVALKGIDITVAGNSKNTGGLVGYSDESSILNCSVSGNINNETSGYTGLLVGHYYSPHDGESLSNCYTSGTVVGVDIVGGVVGNVAGMLSVTNCVSDAGVTSKVNAAGGLFGDVRYLKNLQNAAFLGEVSARYSAGGIAGEIDRGTSYFNLQNVTVLAKNISSVEDSSGFITGRLVGQFAMEISGFFDSSLSGNLVAIGENDTQNNLSINLKDTASQLQVGVDSTDSSIIKFTTNISLSSINSLRGGMEGANSLESIDSFISKLSESQTRLGAIENRLTSTIESIGVNIENLTSSRSTLKDADVAKESSQLLKNQILQQAAATLLSTANQTPALALRLLNGM